MFARRYLKRAFAVNPWTSNMLASQERVVTTPQWPVPYQQRKFRAFPARNEEDQYVLGNDDMGIEYWWATKEKLMLTADGQKVYEGVENLPIKDYVISRSDAGAMAKSYVADIVGYIDMANRENTRILANSTLI